jgi:predicted amidohydrolase YtcJ
MEFDLILKNGNVLTLDPAHLKAEAVIIRGNRIVGVEIGRKDRKECQGSLSAINLQFSVLRRSFDMILID